jgi:hypothetical protein
MSPSTLPAKDQAKHAAQLDAQRAQDRADGIHDVVSAMVASDPYDVLARCITCDTCGPPRGKDKDQVQADMAFHRDTGDWPPAG